MACVAMLFSCKKETTVKETKITGLEGIEFGISCGECSGDCATYYKFEQGKLYLDNVNYGSNKPTYSNNAISDATKIQVVKDLMSKIPSEFDAQADNSTYGCPDCLDQCGFFFSFQKNGVKKKFMIDTKKEKLPVWLQVFQQDITDTMDKLK